MKRIAAGVRFELGFARGARLLDVYRWLRLFACVLALGLSACAGAAACPRQPITDPERALASHQARNAKLHSMRAEARVDQRSKEGRIKGRVLMLVERPDRVRFDAMTQFGPALVLTSDGRDFALSDFKENRYITGPACERNIARMIGVALSGGDVANVLLGDAPLMVGQAGSIRCEGGVYVIERKGDAGGRQELELTVHSDDRNKPASEQRVYLSGATFWDAKGTRSYRVRYEDYRPISGGSAELPFTVRIEDFVNDADALLRFQTIETDVKLPADAFVQSPGAGLTVEQASCE